MLALRPMAYREPPPVTARELRLRQRIDQLLDDRARLRARVYQLELNANAKRKRHLTREVAAERLADAQAKIRSLSSQLHFAKRGRETAEARLLATKIELDRTRRLLRRREKLAA